MSDASGKSLKIGVEVDAGQGILQIKKTTEAVKQLNEETQSAAQFTSDSAAPAAAHYAEALGKVEAQTAKNFASKKQLKDMLKQLQHEFPLLGQAGRLALNPIALAAAGITAAFVIWRKRVNDLTDAMAETEHADFKILDVKRVNAVKEEWKKYGEQVDAVAEKLNGLAAQHEAAMKKIETFFDLVEKLGGGGPVKEKRQTEAELGELSSAAYAARVSRDGKKREAERLTAELNAGAAGLDPKVQESRRAALAQRVSDAESDVEKFKAVTKKEPFGLASQARELAEASLKEAKTKLAGAKGALERFDQGGEADVEKRGRVKKLLSESSAEDLRYETLKREFERRRDELRLSENVRILAGRRPVLFQQVPGQLPGTGVATLNTGERIGVTPIGQGNTLSARVLPIMVKAFSEADAIMREEAARLGTKGANPAASPSTGVDNDSTRGASD